MQLCILSEVLHIVTQCCSMPHCNVPPHSSVYSYIQHMKCTLMRSKNLTSSKSGYSTALYFVEKIFQYKSRLYELNMDCFNVYLDCKSAMCSWVEEANENDIMTEPTC